MLYLVLMSYAFDVSTMIRVALCAASEANSSYMGYNVLQGAHVGDVKNITAHDFFASSRSLSSSWRFVGLRTEDTTWLWVCSDGAVLSIPTKPLLAAFLFWMILLICG